MPSSTGRPVTFMTHDEVLARLMQWCHPPPGACDITQEELEEFSANPSSLVGRQLVLHCLDIEDMSYTVERVGTGPQGQWFQVQHEGLMPVRLTKSQMDELLGESYLVID